MVLCRLEASNMADDKLISQAEFGTVFLAHTLRQAEAPGIDGVRQADIIIPRTGFLAKKPLPRFARAGHEHIRLFLNGFCMSCFTTEETPEPFEVLWLWMIVLSPCFLATGR